MSEGKIPNLPTEAIVAVTYLCNARCNMCNLWQTTEKPALTAEDLLRLPSSLTHVNVTGGEPLLRPDLPDLVRAIKQAAPRAQIVLTTNGFQPKKTEEVFREILKFDPTIEVGVSVDGMKEHHEEIRGIPRGFEKSFETIDRLRNLGVRRVVVAHTMQETNLSSSYKLYQHARREGLDFGCVVTENSEVHFQKTNNLVCRTDHLKDTLEKIARAEMRSWNPKRWFRGLFCQGLYRRAAGGGRSIPCTAGDRFFFLDPWGEVFPCNVLGIKLGNLKEQTFEEIWQGEAAEAVRPELPRCEKCFMSCSVYPEVRRNPLRYAWSAAGLKIQTHLGFPVLREPDREKATASRPEQPRGKRGAADSEGPTVGSTRGNGFPALADPGTERIPVSTGGAEDREESSKT